MRIAHNSLLVTTDVGGGNKKEGSNALSNISLYWMVQAVVKSRPCGVRFARDRGELLQRLNIPAVVGQPGVIRVGDNSEGYYDEDDARVPIEDALKLTKCTKIFEWIFWCILEVLPTYYEWQEMRGEPGQQRLVWFWKFRQVSHPSFRILAIELIEYHDGGPPTTGRSINLWRGRVLPVPVLEHHSVGQRDRRGLLRKILDALVTMWGATKRMPGMAWGATKRMPGMAWGATKRMLGMAWGAMRRMLGRDDAEHAGDDAGP